MGEINRRKMEDKKEIIKIKEPISTANKFHSSELFYIEEAKLPFSAGIYTLTGCAMHWHHSWEILCQLEGEAYVRFGGEKIISRPGDITVISGEEPHETEKITKRHKILLLQFQMEPVLPYFSVAKEYQHIPSILLDPFRKVEHFNLRSKKVESIMWKIEGEYKKKILGYEIRIPAYIMELMVYFMRNDYICARRPATEVMIALEKIRPALSYIEENYQNHIELQNVAELCCMSMYTFCRVFKQATDYTFVEYLNHIRLKSAEKLLLSTKLPISEVAYESGFSGLSYFNRKFKEVYSMGPSRYRKISGNEEINNCEGYHHSRI